MNQSNFTINLYLINQIFDVLLWSWVLLIMIKRVVCNKEHRPFKDLITHRHYLSDFILFIASFIAVCKFSNQFYDHTIGSTYEPNIFTRTLVWMIFHKLLTISLIIKYWKSQPKLFSIIRDELKRLIIWLIPQKVQKQY